MPNKFATANGNFNDASIWSSLATGPSPTTVPDISEQIGSVININNALLMKQNAIQIILTGDNAIRTRMANSVTFTEVGRALRSLKF